MCDEKQAKHYTTLFQDSSSSATALPALYQRLSTLVLSISTLMYMRTWVGFLIKQLVLGAELNRHKVGPNYTTLLIDTYQVMGQTLLTRTPLDSLETVYSYY